MKAENIKTLDTLSWVCHLTGIFSVFIGLMVTFIDILNQDVQHIQVGLYVLITGYAFTKIAKKINMILIIERFNER